MDYYENETTNFNTISNQSQSLKLINITTHMALGKVKIFHLQHMYHALSQNNHKLNSNYSSNHRGEKQKTRTQTHLHL